ncbi:LytTR family DNA-binding domain-containing protein [Lysinibacillus sp. A4]|uniref:LytR/AlgR family response regulator transcription factor n=1 Tax=unclassified Lysinibacillus TaxID=2636778 RepID=UPI002175CFC0|nr:MULTISPECIES: LytTR family DNA-binding domain-containing protein [unclassified Lysinibacillus]MCS5502588.1 LytTR family DNA-binding domain-containing protein [Lysinibacillus sp. A4]WGT40298.1 LytTR family DNA-binding domain-containing protein [Lysinibacillus sp. 1 U-2021]
MIKVFVCEDNEKQRNIISNIIQNYLIMQDYDMKFELSTENPNDIISYLERNKLNNGLYFLDVELNSEMNGISLGVAIRKLDPSAKIVFITTHTELTYLTFLYKVEAMDYIPKDNQKIMQNKIIECIDVVMERYLNSGALIDDNIVVKAGETSIRLNVNEIYFIESSSVPHKLVVHLNNRTIEYYGKIKEAENLSPKFYRCHQSYVVNIDSIQEINKKNRTITMKDGETCYVSTRYLKELLRKFESSIKE